MKYSAARRYSFSACAALALLAGCGGSQLSSGAPGMIPKGVAFVPARTHRAHTHQSYQVLYSFAWGSADGSGPAARLIDVKGALYGTTAQGGGGCGSSGGCGTVYSMTTSGVEQILHSFWHHPRHRYTAFPLAGLLNVNGTLYGTESGGGTRFGSVFSVNTAGKFKELHFFSDAGGHKDGFSPRTGLINVNGTLYGTTYFGGSLKNHREGFGTVYSISTTGAEKVLYRFTGGSDGESPDAGLIDVDGKLYGTTAEGGGSGCFGYGCGTVYSVSTRGVEKVLHRFTGPDGANPQAGLIDVNGALYGTTSGGGSYYGGTVYSIGTTGEEKVLYSFRGGADGSYPTADLINLHGTLYGTTFGGGGCYGQSCGCYASYGGCGTVYSISTSGSENVLHRFTSDPDGALPEAALINVKGTLYGTTFAGGAHGGGTVFTLSP